jgi:hypothetical protein
MLYKITGQILLFRLPHKAIFNKNVYTRIGSSVAGTLVEKMNIVGFDPGRVEPQAIFFEFLNLR